jgi:hypothetical protein
MRAVNDCVPSWRIARFEIHEDLVSALPAARLREADEII